VKAVNQPMVTTTLFDYIQSELIKQGFDEFIDSNGNLVLFDEEFQFMTKILNYDEDVEKIVNRLFNGVSLNQREYDQHFKKSFLYRFLNRQINRQTIESFKVELMATFLMNQQYLNNVYADLDKYITQSQINKSSHTQHNQHETDGITTSDNRQAYAQLPQNNVQLDVDSTVMDSANDNTISRNKQKNNQTNTGITTGETDSENKIYQLDNLLKTNGIMEQILNVFDRKCFLQIW